jgi:predicted permease
MLTRRWVDELRQDLWYAARTLQKSPGFAAVAIVSLALGVGANAGIFSVVKTVLIERLPYPRGERLAVLSAKDHVGGSMSLSYPDVLDWKNQTQVFESVAAYQDYGMTLTGRDHDAERFSGRTVSANFFSTLGVVPSLGRDFALEDDRPGAAPVAIVSHGVWARSFRADPQLIGRSVTFNGRSFTVVGVLPATFQFYVSGEIFAPLGLGLRPSARGERRGIYAIGRLRPEKTFTQAQVEADTIARRLGQYYPNTNAGVGAAVVPLTTIVIGNTGRVVLILFAAVTLVLLIACVNVANLLLARAVARHNEMALRRSLGAQPSRLIRQLLTESLLLAVLGGALGLVLTGWTIRAVNALLPEEIRRLKNVGFDGWVLAFTLLLCLVSSLVFGLAPAWQMVRGRMAGDVSTRLIQGRRGATTGVAHRSLRNVLVTSEVAVSVVLLVAAGLMIRTVVALEHVDSGFREANVLHAQIVLPPAQYGETHQVTFFSALLERTRALPGVTDAALVMCAPLSGGCWANPVEIEGRTPAGPGEPEVNFNAITPGYFGTLGIPLRQGRDFDPHDTRDSLAVAIVNQSYARRYFAGQDPIGKRIREHVQERVSPWTTIVGVVGDVRRRALDAPAAPEVFRPLAQNPINFMTLMVRLTDDQPGVSAAIRTEVQALDRGIPLLALGTMEQVRTQGMSMRRLPAVLLQSFAAIALLLAVVGIYGVIAYCVSQRTGEIAIRLALGARPSNVLWLVVRQGMVPVCAGILLGVASALGVARTLTGVLYGVSATDPLTFALVSALLLTVALVACVIPARHAASVAPMSALCDR